MNAVSTARKPSVEWPHPIVNDPRSALGDAYCKAERLGSLMQRNNDAMLNDVLSEEGVPDEANGIWEIYRIAAEQLADIRRLISAIETATEPQPTSSVAKHVDIRQRHDWGEAVAAYKAAEASPDLSNASFDAAADAFNRVVATRVPNLRCLHEKMTLIDSAAGWSVHGVIDALFGDIEALARKYEIAAKVAKPAPDRAEFERAVLDYRALAMRDREHPYHTTTSDDPGYAKADADHDLVMFRLRATFNRVMMTAAPDSIGAIDKLDILAEFFAGDDEVNAAATLIAADLRRLSGEG